ncbi:hypothetical protein HMPREF9372_0019 [Sporosarcina newyorkensis 2681]|uniref:Uncharacterized protein n=1 Tax=Sporosarcina newyorkensis 2681 TaxID=1027292 RepID=F9DMI9_9BACL|nr:hypothetical protein HMPREF9372_0019 [Sporosarcina newyorkensis 2681]
MNIRFIFIQQKTPAFMAGERNTVFFPVQRISRTKIKLPADDTNFKSKIWAQYRRDIIDHKRKAGVPFER